MHGHMNVKDPCIQQYYFLKDGMEVIFKLHFIGYKKA